METNTMTTGVKSFTTTGREVAKPEFPLITPGKYEARLEVSGARINVASGGGKLPYISCPIEVLNSAVREGGRNRKVFHNFFLSLAPGKDGVAMVDRQNGLTAFSRATGMPLTLEDGGILTMQKANEDGTTTDVDVLNPQQVLKWLQQLDGVVFSAKVKTEKGTAGYPDKSVIDYFIEASPQ